MQPCIERRRDVPVHEQARLHVHLNLHLSILAEAQLSQCSSAPTITTVLLSPGNSPCGTYVFDGSLCGDVTQLIFFMCTKQSSDSWQPPPSLSGPSSHSTSSLRLTWMQMVRSRRRWTSSRRGISATWWRAPRPHRRTW